MSKGSEMNSESGEPSHGEQAGRGKIALRLYVVRSAPNSVRAISNLRAIGQEWFKDGYDLEIVDVLEAPHRALEDDVIVTPTLVKLSPPRTVIVGNLSDTRTVLEALGLRAEAEGEGP
jgi:circadian clock protein KaiB